MAFSGISTGFWHLFFDPKTGDTRDVNCSPPTLWLAATALLFTLIIALPLALWCVAKPHSLIDKVFG